MLKAPALETLPRPSRLPPGTDDEIMATWDRIHLPESLRGAALGLSSFTVFDDARRERKEWLASSSGTTVVTVKAEAAAAAKSWAGDLGKPSVNVLIDTYNHERFIEQATVSVLEQDSQGRSQKRAVTSAATHLDGSARPQTEEKKINRLYSRLIDEFERRTRVRVILHTSFNLRGEASGHPPTDATRTFCSSGMDALVLGSFLVEQ